MDKAKEFLKDKGIKVTHTASGPIYEIAEDRLHRLLEEYYVNKAMKIWEDHGKEF